MDFKRINYIKVSKYIGITLFVFFLFQYYFLIGSRLVSQEVLPFILVLSLGFMLLNLFLRVNKQINEKTFDKNKYIPVTLGLIATVIVIIITLMFI